MARNNNNKRTTQRTTNTTPRGDKTRNTRETDRRGDNTVDNRKRGGKFTGGNDPEWYNKHPDLVRDSSSIWFNRRLGTKFHNYSDYITPGGTSVVGRFGTSGTDYSGDALPGFMIYYYLPGPGVSTGSDSAINVAAQSLYAKIRIDNSGAKNYEAPDLMMYLLAMDEVVQWWANLIRIYGLMNAFSATNNYLPKHIVTAMGYNFDDLQANLANFRAHINSIPRWLSKFYIPGNLDIFKRHIWMSQFMFLDSANDQAQFYIFRNSGYRIWDDTTGTLHRSNLNVANKLTYAQIVDITSSILTPILASEDFGLISGDIRKSWGDMVYAWQLMPEDYITQSFYDPNVLSMIENAVVTNVLDTDITQHYSGDPNKPDYIVWEPQLRIPQNTAYLANADKIMNFHHTDVQPLEVMYSSRFIPTFDIDMDTVGNLDATKDFDVDSCGAEILQHAYIYKLVWLTDGTGPNLVRAEVPSYTQQAVASAGSEMLTTITGMQDLSAFDFAHQVQVGVYTSNQNDVMRIAYDSCKYDVATMVSKLNLKEMNKIALLSLWDFPLGK